MNHDRNATLAYALDLWCRMMSDDFGEFRAIWYPASSPGLECKRSRGAEAFEELESSFEQSIVGCVQGAVESLTATQRGALERHLELTMTVRIPHYEERLEEAMQKVWLALLTHGCAS